MANKHQPTGYQTVIPYVYVPDISAQLKFVTNTFEADVIEEMKDETGTIRHAEVRIGDSVIMFGCPKGEEPIMPINLYVYVPDCDSTYHKAIAAGAQSETEPADQFYGDRSAGVVDAYGNHWWLATHKEKLSSEELNKRMAEREQ